MNRFIALNRFATRPLFWWSMCVVAATLWLSAFDTWASAQQITCVGYQCLPSSAPKNCGDTYTPEDGSRPKVNPGKTPCPKYGSAPCPGGDCQTCFSATAVNIRLCVCTGCNQCTGVHAACGLWYVGSCVNAATGPLGTYCPCDRGTNPAGRFRSKHPFGRGGPRCF